MRYSILLFIAILLSACGGGGVSTSDPTPEVLETYVADTPPTFADPGPLSVIEGENQIAKISATDAEQVAVRTERQDNVHGPVVTVGRY